MSLRWVHLARRGSQVLGAALSAALGVRIMMGAIAVAQAERAVAAVEPAPPEASEPPEDVVSTAPDPPLAAGPEAPPGPSLRLILSVLVGPERSDVFVNGRRVGLSPYIGDFTCKQGEGLRIEVVPITEPLITRHATCQGQALLVRD